MQRIGDDGYPVPAAKQLDRFTCVCPICMGASANMKVAKSGNWIVRCPLCSTIIYLNDITSINLFRGLQKFLNDNPEHQVAHTTGVVTHAPMDGE